jgi:hypothetical protein
VRLPRGLGFVSLVLGQLISMNNTVGFDVYIGGNLSQYLKSIPEGAWVRERCTEYKGSLEPQLKRFSPSESLAILSCTLFSYLPLGIVSASD